MELEDTLTESEKTALCGFTSNETMVKAVQKVLLSNIYFEGTIRREGIVTKNFALDFVRMGSTNEEIGANIRAASIAVKLLAEGFQKLSQFSKKEKQDVKRSNPAR